MDQNQPATSPSPTPTPTPSASPSASAKSKVNVRKQFVITPAAGKRLIAQYIACSPAVRQAWSSGHSIVVIAGSTNGYVVEELIKEFGLAGTAFTRSGFRRGLVTPPTREGGGGAFPAAPTPTPTPIRKAEFKGDVVFREGKVATEKVQLADLCPTLGEGDVVIKGANAVNLASMEAGVYILDVKGGTTGLFLPSVIGRRVQLIVPVGVEKRVECSIAENARWINDPSCTGPRMMPLPGTVVTELEAIKGLTGTEPRLLGGGGVYGAEGSVWLGVEGSTDEVESATLVVAGVMCEDACRA